MAKGRVVLTKAQVLEGLGLGLNGDGPARAAAHGLDPTKIDEAIAAVDQEAILSETEARFTWEVWDQESPIFGRSAEEVKARLLERGDWPKGGEIFVGYVDGEARILQPHAPGPGLVAMTRSNVEAHARRYLRDDLARFEAAEEIVRRVRDRLLS